MNFKYIKYQWIEDTGLSLEKFFSVFNEQPIVLINGILYFLKEVDIIEIQNFLKQTYGIKKLSVTQIIILLLINNGWEGILSQEGAYFRNISNVYIKIQKRTINSMINKNLIFIKDSENNIFEFISNYPVKNINYFKKKG